MLSFFETIKKHVTVFLFLFLKIPELKLVDYSVERLGNNEVIIIPKGKFIKLAKVIDDRKLNIKLISFFDTIALEPCVMTFKELWTDEDYDEKIHQIVRSRLNIEPIDCRYLVNYEKRLQEEKIKFCQKLCANESCVFCFSYDQLFPALSFSKQIKSKCSILFMGKKIIRTVSSVRKNFKINFKFLLGFINVIKIFIPKKIVQYWIAYYINLRETIRQIAKNPHYSFFKKTILICLSDSQLKFLQKNIHSIKLRKMIRKIAENPHFSFIKKTILICLSHLQLKFLHEKINSINLRKTIRKIAINVDYNSIKKTILVYLSDLQLKFLRKKMNYIYSLALVLATGVNAHRYYKSTINTINAFQEKGIRPIIITASILIYIKLLFKKCYPFYLLPRVGHFLKSDDLVLGEEEYFILGCERYGEFLRKITLKMGVKDIILVPHWSYLGFCFLKVAREISGKTYSFPLVTVAPRVSSIIGWNNIDYVFCYGTQCEEAFNKLNHQKKLITIGNIFYRSDDFDQNNEQSSDILIATSNIDRKEILWIEKVVQYCQNNNKKCYINVHPSFSSKIYTSSLKTYKKNVRISKTNNILELLAKCFLCITDCSTVGAEAIFLGKYLMTVNLTGKEFSSNNYSKHGVALHANKIEDINRILDILFNDESTQSVLKSNYQNFYDLFNYKNDGKASERLVNCFINNRLIQAQN